MSDQCTFALKIRKLPSGGFVLCDTAGDDLQAFGDFPTLWDTVTAEARSALAAPPPEDFARRFAPNPSAHIDAAEPPQQSSRLMRLIKGG